MSKSFTAHSMVECNLSILIVCYLVHLLLYISEGITVLFTTSHFFTYSFLYFYVYLITLVTLKIQIINTKYNPPINDDDLLQIKSPSSLYGD